MLWRLLAPAAEIERSKKASGKFLSHFRPVGTYSRCRLALAAKANLLATIRKTTPIATI